MGLMRNIWMKLTPTAALEQSSGKLETLFFEPVYRVAYILGLSTRDHKLQYQLYRTTVRLLIVILMICEICAPITETFDVDILVAYFNVVLLQIITLYRYKSMLNNSDIYKKLAVSMESPNFDISTEKRKKLVNFWAKRSEKYLKILLSLGNSTLAIWLIFPLVDDLEYNLMVTIMVPFKYNTPLKYACVYIITMVAFYYVSHFIMMTVLIMQAHLIHLLCQFTVLSDCFENLLTDCKVGFEDIPPNYLIYNKSFVEKYTKRLGNLVEQHQAILEHTMNLRNILSKPMLGQLAASGILICCIGYQATTTLTVNIIKSVMSILFLGYNLFEFYVVCRWCEEITLESQKIGEAVYSSGWENGLATLPGVKSTINLIIVRANKPLILTAGGMYNLSLTSYGTLVKTSYSALTVLLRMSHD